MMHELIELLETIEPFIAMFVAVFSVIAVLVARSALSKGLTGNATRAAIVSTVIICGVLVWHFIYSFTLSIGDDLHELYELIEYLGYAVAYAVFVFFVVWKSKVKPDSKRVSKK